MLVLCTSFAAARNIRSRADGLMITGSLTSPLAILMVRAWWDESFLVTASSELNVATIPGPNPCMQA